MALRNFIDDSDLKKFYPKLDSQLWDTQVDYEIQIGKAYDKLVTDLYNMGLQPSRVMTPLDFHNNTTEKNSPLISTTETIQTISSTFTGHNERRLVVNVTSLVGSFTASIQGSNESATPTAWETAGTLYFDETGETSMIISTPYVNYRVVTTPSSTATYTIAAYETQFDDVLCHSALAMIFRDWSKEQNDVWDIRRQLEERDYAAALQGVKFAYDANLSGAITTDELAKKSVNITFTR